MILKEVIKRERARREMEEKMLSVVQLLQRIG